MRALRASGSGSGWINFRRRAMLLWFASHHLWIDRRDSGLQLTRQFVDYEPGSHWKPVPDAERHHGHHAIRIYNLLKRGLDQDPDGLFLARWLRELGLDPGPGPWGAKAASRSVT